MPTARLENSASKLDTDTCASQTSTTTHDQTMAFSFNDPAQLTSKVAQIDLGEALNGVSDGLDGLTDILQRFQVLDPTHQNAARFVPSNGKYHELHIIYPACELVPKSTESQESRMYIYHPKEVLFRQEPRLGDFQLDHDNLDFHVKLPTPTTASQSRSPRNIDMPNSNILDMVKRLHEAPGVSKMEVVSHNWDGKVDTTRYLVRLSTTWMTSSGRSREEVLEYECDALSWEAYLAFHPEEQWVKVLNSLIRRSCDRSFLYVRQRLRKFDLAHLIPQDLKEIGSKWSELKIISANEVLLRRLKSHAISRGDGGYIAITPCEDEDQHFIRFKSADIRSLTEDECEAYACSVCGARLMEAREIRRVAILHDLEQRDIYKSKEVWWSHLDTAIQWGHEAVHVPATQLDAVLAETLEGLKVPESVMLTEWCPVNLPETAVRPCSSLARRCHFCLIPFYPRKHGSSCCSGTNAPLRPARRERTGCRSSTKIHPLLDRVVGSSREAARCAYQSWSCQSRLSRSSSKTHASGETASSQCKTFAILVTPPMQASVRVSQTIKLSIMTKLGYRRLSV